MLKVCFIIIIFLLAIKSSSLIILKDYFNLVTIAFKDCFIIAVIKFLFKVCFTVAAIKLLSTAEVLILLNTTI